MTQITQMHTQALNKAKIGIMRQHDSIFITTVLFSLKQRWDSNIPTAQTNGTDLLINPDWFINLSPAEQIGLLAHEAWHVAFQHMLRLNQRNPVLWNMAADHVINLMLIHQGYQLPANGLWDSRFNNLHTEAVYQILQQENQQSLEFQMDLQDPGGNNSDPEQTEAVQEKINSLLVQAATTAKLSGQDPGSLPMDVAVFLDKLLNPKLPWQVILANYVSGFAKNDYSWKRPNRRYLPDYYLPSLYNEALTEICVAIDTSGSVSQHDFDCFISEVHHLQQRLQPNLIRIIGFDCQIHTVHEIGPNDSLQHVEFQGRGGTSLHPVFAYYQDKLDPTVLLVFSDLYCQPIETKPRYPVVWICIDNPHAKVHFGKLIHYSTSE